MAIETGTKLGSYEVQEFIGQGAMGLVYRAYHAQLERSAAVKFLQGIAAGPEAAARFRHEAQAIAQMRHPNIVNVFDFGEFEGIPYMIVEYVPGGNLAGTIQQGPPDQASAMKYLRGIAAGLDYAHSLGIVHRDVKPGNVLLEKDGTPVLADFGLVKLLQGSSVKSMTGVTTGTPAYMSPEQVTGHEVGPAADQYSLATIAYEMLAGTIPFEGEGVLELLYAHVHRDPPPPSSRNGALSPTVDAVILRGLAKDPDARWESCGAFVDALTAALAGEKVPAAARVEMPAAGAARASSAATVAMATPSSASRSPLPPARAARPRGRLFKVVAGVIVLLVLVVAGGICAAALQKPTLSVAPANVAPGDVVTVSATRVPANQVGEIQLRSPLYTFPFRADASGNVSMQIQIPLDIGTGTHHMLLCWNGSCRAQQSLTVVGPGPASTPTPTPSPSRSATPSPSARPNASPSPTPTPNPSISLSSNTIKPLVGTVNVYGQHFPAGTVTIWFLQNGKPAKQVGTVAVGSDGKFKVTITIPKTAVLGQAYIRACLNNTSGPCAYAQITVAL